MNSKKVKMSDVGIVQFMRSARAKRIGIKVKASDLVKVSVPVGISFEYAEKIVREKTGWIKKHQQKLKRLDENRTIFNEDTEFHTKNHRLIIRKTNDKDITAKVADGIIIVFCPFEENVENDSVQFFIRRVIEETYRIEAKQFILPRVRELAVKYGFKYNRVFIKNIKSRWGSCSKKDNLNFSLHLMRLPDELIDYVILHELAHTIEHNHSKKFWDLLDRILGNAKAVDKKVNKYSTRIW